MENQNPNGGAAVKIVLSLMVAIGGLLWFRSEQLEANRRADQLAQTRRLEEEAARRTTTRLQGVAAYKGRLGFAVCTRAPLHNCDVRFGIENGERATLAYRRLAAIEPLATCENQWRQAEARCADAGTVLFGTPEQATAWAGCAARIGVLYRSSETVSIVDPRDTQLDPGRFRMECDEGYMTGEFDNVL